MQRCTCSGAWSKYTEPVTQDITIEAVYTPSQHTVTFTADGTTVKTMTVEHGYVLTNSDYPTVPAKTGYSGAWSKHTEPITQDITVEAVYTINQYKVTFTANKVIVKTMTVNYGYTLKNSDYPPVPIVNGKTGQWTRYTRPITRNITITATYSDAGINPPVKPPIETSSIDGTTADGNGTVKETITAHHTYIYTAGQLAQETITTTVTPADSMSTPSGEIMSSPNGSMSSTGSGTTTTNAANGMVTASGSIVSTTSNSVTTTETLYYAYDANGVPMSLNYTDPDGTTTTYYYATNIQGDVTAILDTIGTPVVEYTYDAWGNPLTTTGSLADTLGERNSLRYRGYVYDTETELYYVSSRYYNPELGRWINADDINYLGADGSLLSYNLFAYCINNPVNRVDVDGNWSMPSWLKVTVGAVAIAGLAVATICTGGATAVICGAALSGAVVGGASGAVMGAIGGGISGGWQGALDGACSGFMSGTLIGGATGAVSAGLNIATGTSTIVGNAHGSPLHKLATNVEAGKMAASGQYSQIGLNKALKTMGLNGSSRPDVIGIARNGFNKLVEVVSPRQSINYITNKMANMLSNNPGSVGKIITWVRNLFK